MTRKRDLLARIAELEAEVRDLEGELDTVVLTAQRRADRIAELEAKLTEESSRVIRMGEYNDQKDAELVAARGALAAAHDEYEASVARCEQAVRQIGELGKQKITEIAHVHYILRSVGDRLLRNASATARREWEIAKTGRNPRDAKGHFVKVDPDVQPVGVGRTG